MKPLVSILIPAYNAEGFIAQTICSALRQTWPAKEIIVVDDGSKDKTIEVARGFSDQGVRVVSQSNQGAAAARNHAFSLSSGDYIQWLDADDLLDANKIEMQVEALAKCNSEKTLFSAEWAYFLHRCQRARFESSDLWTDLSPTEWLLRKMERNLFMQTATWLVSRELSVAAGVWDTRLLSDDDGEYFCRVLLASNLVRFVAGSRVYYRRTGPQSLGYIGKSKRKREAQFVSMKLHIKYLRSLEESERSRHACVQYLQDWFGHFEPDYPDIVREARAVAHELGGELSPPTSTWKYRLLANSLGRRSAERVQLSTQRARWFVQSRVDKILYDLQSRRRRQTVPLSASR